MYDYMTDLDRQAKRDKKRLNSKSKLDSKQAWNNNAYGSAECASSSWDAILDAYNEYKYNGNW